MKILRTLSILSGLFAAAIPSAAADELDIRRIPGTALAGRDKCTTILRLTKVRGEKLDKKPIRTLLLVAGDVGRYSMAVDDELSPPPVWLLMRHRIAVAALNKPGISMAADGSVQVNDNILQNYTIGSLVDCWVSYLRQLERQPPAGLKVRRIVMLGSGEGAHVMIRLYDKLIALRSPLAQRVKTLYLTGFSVAGAYDTDLPYALGKDTWAKVKALIPANAKHGTKLSARARGKAAYELMNKSRGLPWLADLKAHQDLRQAFQRFHKAGSKIYFNMYFGLDDALHDIEGNRNWERDNTLASDAGKPAIAAFVRYYSGGAGLNTAASNDLYTALAWDVTAK